MTRSRTTADRTFRQKAPESRTLTSERIANDLQDFKDAGGRIEVLGVTPVLKKLGDTAAGTETPVPVRASSGRAGSR